MSSRSWLLAKRLWVALPLLAGAALSLNASTASAVVYRGLVHSELGTAVLTPTDTALVVSNIGSSGNDGVSVFQPNPVGAAELDVPSGLPIGGIMTFGTFTGSDTVTVTRVTQATSDTARVQGSFASVPGASSVLVQAFLNNTLVRSKTVTFAGAATTIGGLQKFADVGFTSLPKLSLDYHYDPATGTHIITIDIGSGGSASCLIVNDNTHVTFDHLFITPVASHLKSADTFHLTAKSPIASYRLENESFSASSVVPAVGEIGLVVLALMLVSGAWFVLRRRQQA